MQNNINTNNSLQNLTVNYDMKYYEHSSYKGYAIPVSRREHILPDRHRFKKSVEERLETQTEVQKWRNEMKNKYGTNFKAEMKHLNVHN